MLLILNYMVQSLHAFLYSYHKLKYIIIFIKVDIWNMRGASLAFFQNKVFCNFRGERKQTQCYSSVGCTPHHFDVICGRTKKNWGLPSLPRCLGAEFCIYYSQNLQYNLFLYTTQWTLLLLSLSKGELIVR